MKTPAKIGTKELINIKNIFILLAPYGKFHLV
jgi:hypothetical protein